MFWVTEAKKRGFDSVAGFLLHTIDTTDTTNVGELGRHFGIGYNGMYYVLKKFCPEAFDILADRKSKKPKYDENGNRIYSDSTLSHVRTGRAKGEKRKTKRYCRKCSQLIKGPNYFFCNDCFAYINKAHCFDEEIEAQTSHNRYAWKFITKLG